MALDRSTASHHRVLRARFEIDGPSEAILLNLRAQIAESGETTLPSALDEAFQGLTGPDEMVRINRLEVDLGEIDPQRLDLPTLMAATRDALVKQLDIREPAGPRARQAEQSATTAPDIHIDQNDASEVTRLSNRDNAAAAIATYLKTGQLPADATHLTLAGLYALLVPVADAASILIARIRQLAAHSHRIAALTRLLATAPAPLIDAVAQVATASQLPADFHSDLHADLKSQTGLDRIAAQIAGLVFAPDQAAEASRATSPVPPSSTAETTPTTAVQPVENAGLVLLAPYFPRLFSHCQLTENDRFTSAASRATATQLLHYLATGEAQADEPVLTLPRLICAVPQAQPVLSLAPLDPEMKEQAENLLTAAIGHWSKLANTSPAGLRESFLMRPGVIRHADDQITIALEQHGIDVLLDSLPWSIGFVALPWLTAPIKVDWR